ncbi:aminotransferase class IV [Psychroserpens sp.]|uniref:aminotransferase class IV n=1 Tax=Psychroserpens sp. TaxID=2020870 RepID=UPI001B0CD706|nr:aminotransferase class IV [Psychroserpens sp.]MBO6607566.1 aminotransferase class IV [Psychroserpens sp.]MBO6631644.1 aminotransferase class IV [Psychroserpens sp.]MBO6655226.1 aminotransferase class IV [Psychroserpens sp.]MBO6683184.1 aminotransferase class IV [Psychroserpens sp.]MBO6749748.1 aminotransferase class IV [Psychroserpens sp.]
MINFDGKLVDKTDVITNENRGYKFGDAVFETIKVVHGKILFWEDHYFRLMSAMRIMRMEIPMNFTMEFLESEIINTVEANGLLKSTARVRLNVDRGDGGKYLPKKTSISYNIIAEAYDQDFYTITTDNDYTVDLYKDYYVSPDLLSTLKTNNKAINVLGSIYANENGWQNCLLLNTNKQVVEALNGNIFLIKGETIKTPPLEDGCLKGVMRKQLIDVILNSGDYVLDESSISPFELQKADEIFITNVIVGIQPILKYRKKSFTTTITEDLLRRLNLKLRLA